MRSSETSNLNERNPDAIKFESELIAMVKESRVNHLEYWDLKQKIRKFCVDKAKSETDREMMIKGGYMYFFRFIIDQPESVENVWRFLYAFQEELNQKDNDDSEKIELTTNLTGLFNEDAIGMTINWRLVHSILRGQLEVKKVLFNDEELFYMAEPDKVEADKKFKNKKRSEFSRNYQEFLKKLSKTHKHGQKLIEKPLPSVSRHPGITTEDLKVLGNIYTYLQNDADMIYYSATWRSQIDYFFDVIVRKKIEEILNKLTFNDNEKSQKFVPYFKEVLNKYLGPLKQYCKDLAEQNQTAEKQTNQVPADMMLEPILIANGYLTEEFKTAPIELILVKWEVLWEDIEGLIGAKKTGTLWKMDAFQSQDKSDIAHDDTIQADAFDDDPKVPDDKPVGKKALAQTIAMMPRLTNEIAPETLAMVRGPEGEKIAAQTREAAKLATLTADRVREASQEESQQPPNLWKNVQVDINSTAGMEALTKEAAAFYNLKTSNEPNQDFDANGIKNKAELRVKASCFMASVRDYYSPLAVEVLKQKLEAEILPVLETQELKKEFMLILLEKLTAGKKQFPNENLFEAFENLIKDILNGFIIKSNQDEDLLIPDTSFINNAKEEIPNINDYSELIELLGDSIENRLKIILDEMIQQLQIHRELQAGLQDQRFEAKWLKTYYKNLKKTILGLKKERKKIKGNWLTKPFITLGRKISGKSKANKQANEYFDRLDEAIDIIWEDGIVPTFNNFTALYFDTQNE